MDNFDPYNVLLAIATNIPVLLMTAFVLQGHKFLWQNAWYSVSSLVLIWDHHDCDWFAGDHMTDVQNSIMTVSVMLLLYNSLIHKLKLSISQQDELLVCVNILSNEALFDSVDTTHRYDVWFCSLIENSCSKQMN